ncbi:MAG: hypothetical protein E7G18_05830 [Anaerococcus hydrogenalis]|uniref:hypothetical protein n=1 Tax=Anaerococcus hydrogenalis TaxID=33029 RepID=UPI00290F1032|nr:hypothetical protein [Anaerococcus hydrogenalis]MDU3688188.1 hypothetical protein [Anaerococcus hydrogenalis]
MKKISKFFLKLASIYYLFISLGLFLISLFSLFVNRKYVFAIFDLLGFSNITLEIIKPISFVMLFLLFIIFTYISKKIFDSINKEQNYLFNIFSGFFFIFVSVIGHIFIRDNIFIISYIFNVFLIIGSMLSLREKNKFYLDDKTEQSNDVNYISYNEVNDKKIDNKEEKLENPDNTLNVEKSSEDNKLETNQDSNLKDVKDSNDQVENKKSEDNSES